MKSKLIFSYRLTDGAKVTVRLADEGKYQVYRHYIKGRYAFGLLSPMPRSEIQVLYDNGFFNSLFTKGAE